MMQRRLRYFDEHSEPIARRIAEGLNKIGIAMKQQAWQQANDAGLSATQGQILATLGSHGPLSGKELGERLGLKLPTISDSVKALVAKGLARKSPDPRHPRASLVTPTKRGNALGTRARSWPEFMAEAALELSESEQRAFFNGVMKMIHTLQKRGLIPISGMCMDCVHFRPNVRDGEEPHHCAFVDAPLRTHQMRMDCPEQERADEELRQQLWAQFSGTSSQ